MQISRLMSLIVLFFISLQGYSQKDKVNLTGVIVNHLGKTAEGVSVALKGTAYSTLTNNKGEYKISAKPGNYVLLVTHVGYKTTETAIFLKLGGKPTQDITMEEDMAALNEVAVTGKSKVQRVREQAYNITAIDLKKTYNTSADLNQVLNKTTGVRIREYGGLGSAFNFSLNGFSGNQVKFFLDGVPMDSYGSALTLNNIPVNMAERIDVYKGVVPIELGADALGGAVNIVTNKNVNRYIDASYSYGSFNTHRAAINTRFSGRDGFIANINAFANYADNDYKVDVSVVDKNTSKFLPEQKYKHFHDGYKSGTIMAEAGFKNKSFADYLLVGFAVAGNKKEIQQGKTMQTAIGQAFMDSESFITSLKYKKDNLFTKGLSVNISSTYALVNSRSIDTSSRVYDWTGNYVYRQFSGANDKGELSSSKTLYIYDETNAQLTSNLKYQLSEQHIVMLNYSYQDYRRKQSNEYLKVVDLGRPGITKNILGLSYNFSSLDNRLAISVFGKIFDLGTEMISNSIIQSSSSTNYGYGATSAYRLSDKLQVKGSYEHAYRLPSAEEMLGNGLTIISNTGLKPENSDNVNLGLAFLTQKKNNQISAETSLIYREAKDFIREQELVNISVYENLANVQITGVDGVLRYAYKDFVNFEVNGTYQKSLNRNKFKKGTTSPDVLYNAQLPNVPIFYGNADLTFNFKNIRYQDDKLSLNVSANYIDAFYLTWPVLGSLETKKAIPEQFTQNAMVAYSFLNGKYNLAFECRNITDIKVYDYFKVQKPGRAFSVKFRYFLQ